MLVKIRIVIIMGKGQMRGADCEARLSYAPIPFLSRCDADAVACVEARALL